MLIPIHQHNAEEGCSVLFKGGSGIIICGEERVDGNTFLCKRCLEESVERHWSKDA